MYDWIGTREAAEILGVKKFQTVNYHISAGHIPSAQKVGDIYIMWRAEVEALREKNREWLEAHGRG